MAITRTINYTQNVPITMGFSNVVTSSAAASVYINYWDANADNKMGSIYFDETAGVSITYYGISTDPTVFRGITLTGNQADLNTCLNTAYYKNHFYSAELVAQDLISQNRLLPTDCRGEMQIEISPDCVHGLNVGDYCRLPNAGRYLVTKIDSTNSAIRMWLAFRGDYNQNDTYFASAYKLPAIGNYLQTINSVNITPIIDISYNNPHGDYNVSMTVYDSANTTLDSGVISFVGSFFIAEPYFSTQPSSTLALVTPDNSYPFNLGSVIAQADNNYQSLQLLLKYYENDPSYLGVTVHTALPGYPSGGTADAQLQFIGDAINAKAKMSTPAYVTDNTMGQFGNGQVDVRISTSPASGVVRWHFYGTPAECNTAVKVMTYYRPASVTKDLKLETRIVNGRTRIYSARGK